MPNGGSDCCGTCWFNAKNKGEAGYAHANDPEPDFCTIREVAIEVPFWTYCANHPQRSPERDPIPIGPLLVNRDGTGRNVWKDSSDSEEIRRHLLDLLAAIVEPPSAEYPIGIYRDEVVVWQLGEFRESRAVQDLRRIVSFDPEATTGQPFNRTRETLVQAAEEALAKIEAPPQGAEG